MPIRTTSETGWLMVDEAEDATGAGRPEPGSLTVDADATPVDGRSARAARTRAAIVDALLGLLEEGELQPTATRIAERAGTSLRLIYHHFGDLESLFQAAADRAAERVAALSSPIDPTLPFDARLEALLDQRARVLEWITPVRRAAMLHEPYSTNLRQAREAMYALGEDQVTTVFAAELDGRPAAIRSAVSTVLAWGMWNDLRLSGRTVDDARDAVAATVRALLDR